jgi:glycosyltransferase involved in cell wall biosynthesis
MKILILAPEFLPLRGGIGTYIVELIKNMPKDIEIHVLTPKRKAFTNSIKDIFSENVTVHFTGISRDDILNNFLFQMNCRKMIPELVKKYNIDLVHSQSTLPDLYLTPESINVPIVTTIHTTIRDEINSIKSFDTKVYHLSNSEKTMLFVGPLLKYFENTYYSGNRHYITVSKWMKDRFINDFSNVDENKIKVIYNGVNTEIFNPSEKRNFKKNFPELSEITKPKVLYLSRWAERKGIRFFLKAIPDILKKVDVHFVFAGPNNNNKNLIPSENCTFLGYIPQNKLPCLYASCEMFLLPSLLENFPFVLLEAMSCESAAISCAVGGVAEMISNKENGLLIRPKNIEDIVNSVVYLATNDAERIEIGKRARKIVKERFVWDKIALDTCDYYKEVLEKESKIKK